MAYYSKKCGCSIRSPCSAWRFSSDTTAVPILESETKMLPMVVLSNGASCTFVSSKLDFSHLRTKGVRYAGHRNPPKEAIDAYPTGHDDTGFDPVRATVLQARLAACPGAFGGRDPCPRKEDRKLCLARNGVG